MKIVRLLFIACVAIVSFCCTSTPKVEPLYSEKWDVVETYIRKTWPEFVETKAPLPKPYLYGLNPGTLYYGDLYFHNEGLMRHGYWEIAKNNLECMIFQIDSLGFIPTAIHWGTDRSQTPCFSISVRRYYELSLEKDKTWLKKAYDAVLKEYAFWTNMDGNNIENHSTSIPGLQRYGHHADTASLIRFYERVCAGRFGLSRDTAEHVKIEIASHRLAEAESCMDFTPRFEGRCMEYIPVGLNCCLWGYETDLAFYEKELGIESNHDWSQKARERAALIDQYLWSEERGIYLDYDFVNKRHSPVASMAALMPLHFGFASKHRAKQVKNNLHLFDSDGGMVVCEISPQKIRYQWGHDAVWAPIQQIGMEAMLRYGFHREAETIALKWLNTVTKNYVSPQPATHRPFRYGDGTRHPGFLWEKYTRSGDINDFEYPCSFMCGWTASAYLVALDIVRK